MSHSGALLRQADLLRRCRALFPDAGIDCMPMFHAFACGDALDALDERLRCDGLGLDLNEVETALARLNVWELEKNLPVRSADWPITTKDDFRSSIGRWINQKAGHGPLWVKATSGTSGPPIQIVQSAVFHFDGLFRAVHRAMSRFCPRHAGPALVIALTENPDCVDTIWPDPWGGITLQIKVDERKIDSLGSTVELIEELEADVVTLKPNLLQLLVSNCNSQIAKSVFVSGADVAVDLQRSAMSRFGIPVVQGYGTTETCLIASNCCAFAGLHIDCDVRAEVVDDFGRALPDGEVGSLAFTTLRNSALPLIRYSTGDFGRIDRSQCLCGRISPRITALAGRNMGNFSTKRGLRISPTRFHALFEAVAIVEFQITEFRRGEWSVVVEPVAGQSEPELDDLKSKVSTFMRERADAEVEIDVKIGLVDRGAGKYQRYRAFGSNAE